MHLQAVDAPRAAEQRDAVHDVGQNLHVLLAELVRLSISSLRDSATEAAGNRC